jgi:hypothetical protein
MIICCLTTTETIAVINILVTSTVGIWIARSVQNNLSKTRYLKDYYIQEVKEIRELYKCFFDEMYNGKLSAIYIKDWFKIMSFRINNLNEFLQKTYKFSNSIIKDKHFEIQNSITRSEIYNEKYKDTKLVFDDASKSEMLKQNAELTKVFMQRVLDINNAKKSKN